MNRDFRRLRAKAGLPSIKFHGLRHGAATLMLREGISMKLIQELLGHSSIAVTSGFYLHLDEEFKRQGAEAMDRALLESIQRVFDKSEKSPVVVFGGYLETS